MSVLLVALGVIFIFLNGRNDGGPLVSLPLQTVRNRWWVPLLSLWVAMPLVPFFGFDRVARSLQDMMGFSPERQGEAVVVIAAVLVTLLMSQLAGIPTSITLALVGSLTGATLFLGAAVDKPLLLRVVLLGMLAPLVAAGAGYLLMFVPLRAPKNVTPHQMLRIYRAITYPALVIAYAVNDGQKVLFALALILHSSVEQSAHQFGFLLAASTVFMVGVFSGLRSAGRFIRHGITAVSPVGLVWTETCTALTVIGGASVGVPLSMTQSLTGALLGVGLARSRKAVYWKGMRRVGIAWLWTLPFAGLAAYGGMAVLSMAGWA